MEAMASPQRTAETSKLAELEEVVERGLGTFVEVGEALLKIRDERLYRADHATMEEYCRKRWGMGRRYANRVIEAASIVTGLGPIGPKPQNEAQARALGKAPPEKRPEIMAAVGGKPTAEAIEAEVAKRKPLLEVVPDLREVEPDDPVETWWESTEGIAWEELVGREGALQTVFDEVRALAVRTKTADPLDRHVTDWKIDDKAEARAKLVEVTREIASLPAKFADLALRMSALLDGEEE